MKSFIIWFAVFSLFFTILSVSYHIHLTDNPKKILIALDESFFMSKVQSQVKEYINSLKNTPYTQFSIITNRRLIHSWQPEPILGQLSFYGPRDNMENIVHNEKYPEIKEADEIYLLTNLEDTSGIILTENCTIIRFSP